MNYRETDDIWRLYRREWVTVHTMDLKSDAVDAAHLLFDQIRAWMTEHLTGRVEEKDMNIEMNTDNQGSFWAHALVYKDTLKGEFKYVEAAQHHAIARGYTEYTIVPRNSKSDHDIRSYGIVKL
jgi:mannose-6-phosphate isomerase class I